MKKFLLALIIALPVEAQSNVNVGGSCTGGVQKSTTAAQDGFSLQAKLIDNAALCLQYNLASTCTQAQLNAVSGCAAGACGTIYALTAAGTGNYGLDNMFNCYFNIVQNKVTGPTARAAASLILLNGSDVATNTECANAVGGTLGNGCTYAQLACRAASKGTSSTCVASQ